jgi:hypothetical protein
MIVSGDLERMWEVLVACRHLPVGAEEDHKRPQDRQRSGGDSNREPPEYLAILVPTATLGHSVLREGMIMGELQSAICKNTTGNKL